MSYSSPTSLVLLLSLVAPIFSDKGAFSYGVTSSSSCCRDPLYDVDVGSTVDAVNYALEYVNGQPELLPGLNLSYGEVSSAKCPVSGSRLDDLLSVHNYAILGYSCTEHAQFDAFTGPLFNFTPTVVYTPTSASALLLRPSTSSEQPVLFRLHPSHVSYATSVLALAREFAWDWVVVITEGATFFQEVLSSLVQLSSLYNVTIFQADASTIPEHLHITFLNMNSSSASRTICQLSSTREAFPESVWITYGGNNSSSLLSPPPPSSCNISSHDGLLTIQADPRVVLDEDTLTINTSSEIRQLERTLSSLAFISSSYPLSYYAVDAVLALAQAINDTLSGWSNNSPDWSFCEGEESEKKASISKCFVKQKLLGINIQGLTGPVSFNTMGEREQQILGLAQVRLSDNNLDSVPVGLLLVNGNGNVSEFQFLMNESSASLFRGPIPNATSPVKVIRKYPLAFFIVYSILATVGNIFCLVCFLFNVIFRKRKIVRLISPKLNYFVILGAVLLYSSVYFRVYPSDSLLYASVRCNLQAFMTCVGYVLCFAPVLMKMLRVVYIFRNPTHKKKAVKDWHLFLGCAVMVGIITTAVVLSFVVPVFKPNPMLVEDQEMPPRTDEQGLERVYCVYQCYGFTISLLWISGEYFYLLLLQVAAFVLAVATCRVKIRVLNDSKEMLIIAYTTTAVMLVLGVITFILPTYLITNEAIFSFGIMLATTILLGLLFIPKMVDLYRDPRGEGIFGHDKTMSHIPTTNFTESYKQQNGGNSNTFANHSTDFASRTITMTL